MFQGSFRPQSFRRKLGQITQSVFAIFLKRRRPSKARSLGRLRRGEIPLRRLLFAKLLSFLAETRTPCKQGAFAAKCHRLSLSSRRIFCACAAKEKAGYRLSICSVMLNMNFVINLGFPLGGSSCAAGDEGEDLRKGVPRHAFNCLIILRQLNLPYASSIAFPAFSARAGVFSTS